MNIKGALKSDLGEVIIVDDASTDGTADILDELTDARVRTANEAVNGGGAQPGAPGSRMCTSSHVTVHVADLEHRPDAYPDLLNPIVSGRAEVAVAHPPIGQHLRFQRSGDFGSCHALDPRATDVGTWLVTRS